jgi:hypothetical protein
LKAHVRFVFCRERGVHLDAHLGLVQSLDQFPAHVVDGLLRDVVMPLVWHWRQREYDITQFAEQVFASHATFFPSRRCRFDRCNFVAIPINSLRFAMSRSCLMAFANTRSITARS